MENTNITLNTPLAIAEKLVRVLDEKKARDIRLLHVEKQTVLADYFVLCSGTSSTQLKTLAGEAEYQLAQCGVELRHLDGYPEATWIALDFGSVMVHIFNSQTRSFYNLEKLWNEAESIDIAPILAEKEKDAESEA